MKLEQSFDVQAPAERVWEALIDIERVVPCLPGAALTGRDDEGTYDGTFSVKIGPTTASYSGKLKLEQVDEAAHSAQLRADGTDRRGQGGARATITSSVQQRNGGARVEVITDYQITGRLARFGRGGMIEDIAGRLLSEFAQRLQASLAEGGEAHTAGPPDEAGTPEEAATPREAGTAQEAATPKEVGTPQEAGPAAAGGEPRTAGQAAPPPPASFTPPPAGEPLEGGSLIASVALDRARRNPTGVAAVIAGLLVLVVLMRRRR